MKTIAHFVSENIKTHQRFIYNQIVKITNYRTIVIAHSTIPTVQNSPFKTTII